jgi:hypothetical protein
VSDELNNLMLSSKHGRIATFGFEALKKKIDWADEPIDFLFE